MSQSNGRNVLGILGGMGPLSSAEFLKTIYEHPRANEREQDSPAVMVYSDPAFPDRTEAFLKGDDDVVLKKFVEALSCLLSMGATRIVICCVTIHYLLPRLPDELRSRIISVLDVIFDQLSTNREKHLLISSTGTQKLKLFQSHEQWNSVHDRIVFPDESDQHHMHALIYQLKNNRCLDEAGSFLESMLTKYEVNAFITGCSEVHMLSKHFLMDRERQRRFRSIDPFAFIAKQLPEGYL